MLLIAGLGNPGAQYAHNRHNFGFLTVDEIAERWRFGPWKKKFQGLAAEGEIGGVRALILKPQTYYNESGRAVQEAMRFYKLAPADVVVFHDEIDLAPGRLRMKTGGGAAGNNGIRSISAWLDTDAYRRARLGTGHPGHADLVHGHVLSDFAKSEREGVDKLLDAIAKSAPLLAHGDDEKFQGEVMRLAPAEKAGGRKKPDEESST